MSGDLTATLGSLPDLSELEIIGLTALIVLISHMVHHFVLPSVSTLFAAIWVLIVTCVCILWRTFLEVVEAVWVANLSAIRRMQIDLRTLRKPRGPQLGDRQPNQQPTEARSRSTSPSSNVDQSGHGVKKESLEGESRVGKRVAKSGREVLRPRQARAALNRNRAVMRGEKPGHSGSSQ